MLRTWGCCVVVFSSGLLNQIFSCHHCVCSVFNLPVELTVHVLFLFLFWTPPLTGWNGDLAPSVTMKQN